MQTAVAGVLNLAGRAAGDYYLKVLSGGGLARYELLPTIGAAGASVIDLAGAGQGSLTLGAVAGFANLSASTPYLLKISAPNRVPTIYDLTVRLDETGALQTVDLATRSNAVRRDVILGGNGNDVLSGGAGEEWIWRRGQ